MADEKVKLCSKMASVSDAMAYSANMAAFRPGITPQESTAVYKKWAESGQYEKHGTKSQGGDTGQGEKGPTSNVGIAKDLNRERYRGPVIAAEAVGEFFPSDRAEVLIIDVASGTGFVGEELWKLGFRRIHALDPSEGMLELARQKKVYEKEYCCYLGTDLLPIGDNEYDCAVIAGGMGEGHIPVSGLAQLARIVKPGGLVCIVMREEYLEHVAEYRGRLENTMAEMENMGLWRLQSRVVVPRYFFAHTGIVFKFIIC